jgi:hypothetical protein
MIVKKKYENSVNLDDPNGYWENFYVHVVSEQIMQAAGKMNRIPPSVLYEAINDALKPYKAKLDNVFTNQYLTVVFQDEAAYAWFKLKWS